MQEDEALLLLRQAFLRRYLAWCLGECQKEVDEGLRRLRALPSSFVHGVVRILEAYTGPEQLQLLTALNAHSAQQLGMGLPTASQEDLIRGYQREIERWMQSPEYGVLLSKAALQKVVQKNLVKVVKKEVDSLLGTPSANGPGCVRYGTPVGAYTLFTEIATNGRRIWYHHTVHVGRHGHWPAMPHRSRVCEMVSLTAWLGVFGATTMDTFGTDQVPTVVGLVRELCAYFKDALPGIAPAQ